MMGFRQQRPRIGLTVCPDLVDHYILAFGYGYKALASALNAKGYLTQRGKPFTRESVRTLLKNLGVHTVGAEEECSKEQ